MKKNHSFYLAVLPLLLFCSSVFAQTDLNGATITLSPSSFDYDGTAHEPAVSGIRKGTKRYNSLAAGVDYDISYKDNVNIGEATATIKFKGDYTGTATKTFTINPKDLTDEEFSIDANISEVIYDGIEKEPGIADVY